MNLINVENKRRTEKISKSIFAEKNPLEKEEKYSFSLTEKKWIENYENKDTSYSIFMQNEEKNKKISQIKIIKKDIKNYENRDVPYSIFMQDEKWNKGTSQKNATKKEVYKQGKKNSNNVQNFNSLERNQKKEIDIDNAVRFLLKYYYFISFAGEKLFYFNGKYYEELKGVTKATTIFKECLDEENNRLTSGYREIFQQLLSEKEIWIEDLEELNIRKHRLVFQNGTYDVLLEKFYLNQFFSEDYMFSIINMDYDESRIYSHDSVDRFVSVFCNGDERKENLLYEIVGYCMSNYSNMKACFYLMGVPNAGKSVLCKFIQLAVGKEAYISIPVKELGGTFNTGELVGKKVCADEDVAIMSPLTTKDLSIIKKISSSDTIQTNSKYKKQGYIRPDCKLLWAGNGMFRFATNEDLTPFAERLVIFPLEEEIPRNERDPFIIEKLVEERNYIINRALEALHNLVENQFKFSLVVDSQEYIPCTQFVDGISAFVEECCVLDLDSVIESAELYEAYEIYCSKKDYQKQAKNMFIHKIREQYNLKLCRTAKSRKISGIKLY